MTNLKNVAIIVSIIGLSVVSALLGIGYGFYIL